MSVSYINKLLTREEFFLKSYKKGNSKGYENLTRSVITDVDRFCEKQYSKKTDDVVIDLKKDLDAMLNEDAIIIDTRRLDDPLVQETMQQEYDDAVYKFNQRYGYIYNHDFYIIESIDMINDDTSSNVNIKELSQIEISKALKIFEQYGTVYSQD